MKMLIILYLFIGEEAYKIKEFSTMTQCLGYQSVLDLAYKLPTKERELQCKILMEHEGGARFQVEPDELNNEI